MSIEKLINAVEGEHEDEVKRLLSGGLDVNSLIESMWTALDIAMRQNKVSIVKLLLARPETRLDITDNTGYTPLLHIACEENSAEVIRPYCRDARCTPALLNMKCDGSTPLMEAVYWGNLDCVRELARVEGVDWETKNSDGDSLLEMARRNEHQAPEIVAFLEEREGQEERPAQRPRVEENIALTMLKASSEQMINDSSNIKVKIERLKVEKNEA